jgi:hypothetical protein
MTPLHPSDDALLLFAYDELDGTEATGLTAHLDGCAECRARLEHLERARVAADWVLPARSPGRRRRARVLALGALAAAAVVAAILLRPATPPASTQLTLRIPRYSAPGLAPIDSALTRLEQEKLYAIP